MYTYTYMCLPYLKMKCRPWSMMNQGWWSNQTDLTIFHDDAWIRLTSMSNITCVQPLQSFSNPPPPAVASAPQAPRCIRHRSVTGSTRVVFNHQSVDLKAFVVGRNWLIFNKNTQETFKTYYVSCFRNCAKPSMDIEKSSKSWSLLNQLATHNNTQKQIVE